MHEWSIVEALLARVDEEARTRGATHVHRLRVRLGALSGVEPGLLLSAYEVFRAGTMCAHAPLDLVAGSARWRCARCDVAVPPDGALVCPCCRDGTELAASDEIVLERIEMEVP
jgi:hydrogenase nickel incorporation protein HypA/HybF